MLVNVIFEFSLFTKRSKQEAELMMYISEAVKD